jgi:uncharacterized membrane protein
MEKNAPPADVTEGEVISPLGQVRNLIEEVRALAEVEVDYVKARISYSGGILRKAGLFALLALLFLSSAVIALIIGLLLIVANYWGPIVATLVVVALFATAALGAALYARNTARKLKFEEDTGHG